MAESKIEMIICDTCKGSGKVVGIIGTHGCDYCDGSGKIMSMTLTRDDNVLDFSKFKKEKESAPLKKPYTAPTITSKPPEIEFRPLLPFEDQSPSFTYGFELGSLFHILFHMKPDEWSGPCHSENISMLSKLAEVTHYSITVKPTEYEEWIEVCFMRLPGHPAPRVS